MMTFANQNISVYLYKNIVCLSVAPPRNDATKKQTSIDFKKIKKNLIQKIFRQENGVVVGKYRCTGVGAEARRLTFCRLPVGTVPPVSLLGKIAEFTKYIFCRHGHEYDLLVLWQRSYTLRHLYASPVGDFKGICLCQNFSCFWILFF